MIKVTFKNKEGETILTDSFPTIEPAIALVKYNIPNSSPEIGNNDFDDYIVVIEDTEKHEQTTRRKPSVTS